jgi:hypothetical protein
MGINPIFAKLSMIFCALALMIGTADAKPRQSHARADLAWCAADQSYRSVCPGPTAGATARRAGRAAPMDANGNRGNRHEAGLADARGYCRRETAAGTIVIACRLADRMTGFIGDVVARGFKGRVKCFSTSRSHVPRSLHFIAEACDFAQRGWGKTVAPMYRVADLAAKWGLRDGCTFRDCGHIDSGRGVASVPWPARMAEMKARTIRR